MEMKFTEIPCRYQRMLLDQNAQREQTLELRLEDGFPDIGKVLGCWGQVCLRGKDWRSGGVGISGGVTARVLYQPEDGGEERVVEAWIPFQQKWEGPEEGRDGFLCVSPRLRSIDARTVSPRKLMLRATVSTWARAFVPEQAQLPVPQIPQEDIQLLTLEYPMELICGVGERLVNLEEALTLPEPEGKLLRATLEPVITEQKIIGSRLVFRGCGNLELLYLQEGHLKTLEAELPFSQYADLEGEVSPAATARLLPVLTELELERQEGKLLVKGELTAQYLLSDRQVVTVAQDAYSCRRQVEPMLRELSLPTVLEDRRQELTAACEYHADVAKVVDLTALPDHPVRQGDGLAVSGCFQLLYEDSEGRLQWATPGFEMTLPLPAEEHTRIDGQLWPLGQPEAVLTGDGVKLTQSLRLDTQVTGNQTLPAAEGLQIGEEKEPDPARPSIILRRCGEEPLWQIAKGCGSTVEAIRKANHLEAEPAAEQLLLIPVL